MAHRQELCGFIVKAIFVALEVIKERDGFELKPISTRFSSIDNLPAVNTEDVSDLSVGFPVGLVDENNDYFIQNHVSFIITKSTETKLRRRKAAKKTTQTSEEVFGILQVEANPKR